MVYAIWGGVGLGGLLCLGFLGFMAMKVCKRGSSKRGNKNDRKKAKAAGDKYLQDIAL